MDKLFKLKEQFSEQGILISFNGPFNHSIIEEIGNATKNYLEGMQSDRGVISDVFAVYIEQTQNITNYYRKNDMLQGAFNSAIVLISFKDDLYTVRSGNNIFNKDVPSLKEKLDRLNSADKSELKKMYKEQLRKTPEPGAFGAGLGLIDMARRAFLKLDYIFEPIDNDYCFFNLNVSIKGAGL